MSVCETHVMFLRNNTLCEFVKRVISSHDSTSILLWIAKGIKRANVQMVGQIVESSVCVCMSVCG